jgi:hypothetical protein
MGAVPGIRSMMNSISLSGGIPGSSSGNTSGYCCTTGTSSMVLASKLETIGLTLDPQVWHFTLIPSWLTNDTSLVAQLITPLYRVNQSIPRITSIPLDLSTTKSARKTTPLKMILIFKQPR